MNPHVDLELLEIEEPRVRLVNRTDCERIEQQVGNYMRRKRRRGLQSFLKGCEKDLRGV